MIFGTITTTTTNEYHPARSAVKFAAAVQPKGARHTTEIQMQNLYSSCIYKYRYFKWGCPRFAVHAQYVHLMAGFGPRSAAFTRSSTTTTATATILRDDRHCRS